MRPHTVAVAALVVLITAPSSAHALPRAAPAPSGFRGIVTRGPITPVCRVGIPCTAPAAGVALIFTRAGHAGVRTRTDREGRYRIELPAGIYVVSTGFARSIERPSPRRVKVRLAHVDRLDFFIDTGIR